MILSLADIAELGGITEIEALRSLDALNKVVRGHFPDKRLPIEVLELDGETVVDIDDSFHTALVNLLQKRGMGNGVQDQSR